MRDQHKVIAGLKLLSDRPTTLSYRQLHQWVIWQYPRSSRKGFCGAVHPPIAEHDWIPAVIQFDKKRVRVYAHLDQTFPSPETAVAYFDENG